MHTVTTNQFDALVPQHPVVPTEALARGNAIPDLRVAKSEGKARKIVQKFVELLETLVIDQFLDYLDEYNLLPPAKHGFRKCHSTVTALVKTIQKWTSQKGSAIASFDYSAAFDTISKETVQQRLEYIGAEDSFKAWLTSYMGGGRTLWPDSF